MNGVVDHLDRQVRSSQKLLGIVLAQGEAIRRQDVEGVLARLGDVQAEMLQRQRLEAERDLLVREAAARLGTQPDDLELEQVLTLLPQADAARARTLSAELRGLLTEIGHVHEQNRLLIRQELSFLDHLMRLLSGTPQAGYSATGWQQAPQAMNAIDARA